MKRIFGLLIILLLLSCGDPQLDRNKDTDTPPPDTIEEAGK